MKPVVDLTHVASAILADVEPGFQPGGKSRGNRPASGKSKRHVITNAFSGRQDAAFYVRQGCLTLLAALIALTATSCKRPSASEAHWDCERSAETNGLRATLQLDHTNATPGAVFNCELVVQSPAATHLETPQLILAGTELVNFAALPVTLGDSGEEVRQFRWTFQAGPPGVMTNASCQLHFIANAATNSLAIELPAIVIRSAFAPGTFSNALPPLEVTNAF